MLARLRLHPACLPRLQGDDARCGLTKLYMAHPPVTSPAMCSGVAGKMRARTAITSPRNIADDDQPGRRVLQESQAPPPDRRARCRVPCPSSHGRRSRTPPRPALARASSISSKGTIWSWSPCSSSTGGFTTASACQQFGHQQPSRKSDNPGNSHGAARRDVQAIIDPWEKPTSAMASAPRPFVRKPRIQKRIQIVNRRCHARARLRLGRSVEPRDRKPLESERIARTRLGRVRRDEHGIGKVGRQRIGEAQKIGPIRPVAMQEHDEAFRLP